MSSSSRGLLSSGVILLFIVFVVYSVFLGVQRARFSSAVNDNGQEIAALQQQIGDLQAEGLDRLAAVQSFLDGVHEREITWSIVLQKLAELQPVDVTFSSYSGSDTGNIAVSATAVSYASVANLLSVLDRSASFSNAFVPSVGSVGLATGLNLVGFTFSMDYTPNKRARTP